MSSRQETRPRASSSKAVGQPTTFECGRCSKPHNGTRPGPGWSVDERFGHICDSCAESLGVAQITGTPVARAA